METIYLLISGFLSFTTLYIILKRRLSSVIEEQLHNYYQNQLRQDLQEFYREMESYSAIIESRILRLKKLVERQESSVNQWRELQEQLGKTKKTKEIQNFIDRKLKEEQYIRDSITALKTEIMNLKKAGPAGGELPFPVQDRKPAKKKTADLTTQPSAPVSRTARHIPEDTAQTQKEPLFNTPDFESDEDSTAAEELVDFMDTLQTRKRRTPDAGVPAARPQPENADKTENSSFINILSSIGKALSPVIPGLTPVGSKSNPADEKKPAKDTDAFRAMLTQKFPEPKKQTLTDTYAGSPERKIVPPPSLQKQARPPVPENKIAEEVPEEIPVTMFEKAPKAEKRIDPDELTRLIENLRISSARPQALKALLNSGFKLDQISEISNIPHSDLELTRSVYNIE